MLPKLGKLLLIIASLPLILYVNVVPFLQDFVARIAPSSVPDNAEFDFIVVGSGSAGSVVAGRLAESGFDVLLVEAGGPPNFLMSIPGLGKMSMSMDVNGTTLTC